MRESATLGDVLALVERLNQSGARRHPGPVAFAESDGRRSAAARLRHDCSDKDVDGFGAESVGLLSQNRPKLVACTPAGVIELLEREKIESAAAMPL